MEIIKEYESEKLLKKEGFKVAVNEMVRNLKEAKETAKIIGYPVVLKNTNLLHKSEKNGVRMNVYETNLEKEFKDLKSEYILIQKQVKGTEFLLGIKKDDVFGHTILFGLGGIYTELLNDISIRIYPITKKDAIEMVDDIKNKKIFNYRNIKLNKEEIVNNLMKLNDLIKKYPNIKELDINPLMLNEKEAIIVDARIIME